MNNKKILIISPDISLKGQPVSQRTQAYIDFFRSNDVEVINLVAPVTLMELVKLIFYIYKNKISNILITMPRFRNWTLLMLPGIHSILDIRDGWSIGIKSGYGGIYKPNKIKYLLSKITEYIGIKQANLTVTCTPGLQKYLQNLSGKKIILILNGYSNDDQNIVDKLLKENIFKTESTKVRYVCAGKFSEYGIDRVKKVIDKIHQQDIDKIIELNIVGASIEKNMWIKQYIIDEKYKNFNVYLIDRVSKKELFKIILESDIAISIIRDPEYDFGTKVFDYILCQKPILNYFDKQNPFLDYFGVTKTNILSEESFLREKFLNQYKKELLSILK